MLWKSAFGLKFKRISATEWGLRLNEANLGQQKQISVNRGKNSAAIHSELESDGDLGCLMGFSAAIHKADQDHGWNKELEEILGRKPMSGSNSRPHNEAGIWSRPQTGGRKLISAEIFTWSSFWRVWWRTWWTTSKIVLCSWRLIQLWGSDTTCKSQKTCYGSWINLITIKVRNPMIILCVYQEQVMNIWRTVLLHSERTLTDTISKNEPKMSNLTMRLSSRLRGQAQHPV